LNETLLYHLVIADDHPLFRGAQREARPTEPKNVHDVP